MTDAANDSLSVDVRIGAITVLLYTMLARGVPLRDAVASALYGDYLRKYGRPDAASIWAADMTEVVLGRSCLQ